MSVIVAVSWGELIDKITILEIKRERLGDPARRANVDREYSRLIRARDDNGEGDAVIVARQQNRRAKQRFRDHCPALQAVAGEQDSDPEHDQHKEHRGEQHPEEMRRPQQR